MFLFCFHCAFGLPCGVPNLWGASPQWLRPLHIIWFRSLGSLALSSMCGRRLCVIPISQATFLKAETAAYSGVDSRVARTKKNDEMKKKRVSRRLGEAEHKTECDDPSICVLDDLAVEELNVGSACCLLLSRKRSRRRRMS